MHRAARFTHALIYLVGLASACTAVPGALAQQVSSADLIDHAAAYDGKTVVFKGEVIGDRMVRNEYAWINVNDGANAMGIWVRRELAGAITLTGGYTAQGDTVQVLGVFHRSCLEHGGDMDIHAQSLEVVKKGAAVTATIDIAKAKVAAVLAAAAGLVWILSYLKNL